MAVGFGSQCPISGLTTTSSATVARVSESQRPQTIRIFRDLSACLYSDSPNTAGTPLTSGSDTHLLQLPPHSHESSFPGYAEAREGILAPEHYVRRRQSGRFRHRV